MVNSKFRESIVKYLEKANDNENYSHYLFPEHSPHHPCPLIDLSERSDDDILCDGIIARSICESAHLICDMLIVLEHMFLHIPCGHRKYVFSELGFFENIGEARYR